MFGSWAMMASAIAIGKLETVMYRQHVLSTWTKVPSCMVMYPLHFPSTCLPWPIKLSSIFQLLVGSPTEYVK